MTLFRPTRSRATTTRVDLAPLRVRPCRDLCSWHRTPVERRGEAMFACRGCGSQWVPGEHWTPRDRDGAVPPEILAIRRAEAPEDAAP